MESCCMVCMPVTHLPKDVSSLGIASVRTGIAVPIPPLDVHSAVESGSGGTSLIVGRDLEARIII